MQTKYKKWFWWSMVFFVGVLVLPIGSLVLAQEGNWQPPLSDPPNRNVYPPLNTGSMEQEKVGGLTITEGDLRLRSGSLIVGDHPTNQELSIGGNAFISDRLTVGELCLADESGSCPSDPIASLHWSRELEADERLIEFDVHRGFDLRREDNDSDAGANLVFNSRVGGNYWEFAHDGSTIAEFHQDHGIVAPQGARVSSALELDGHMLIRHSAGQAKLVESDHDEYRRYVLKTSNNHGTNWVELFRFNRSPGRTNANVHGKVYTGSWASDGDYNTGAGVLYFSIVINKTTGDFTEDNITWNWWGGQRDLAGDRPRMRIVEHNGYYQVEVLGAYHNREVAEVTFSFAAGSAFDRFNEVFSFDGLNTVSSVSTANEVPPNATLVSGAGFDGAVGGDTGGLWSVGSGDNIFRADGNVGIGVSDPGARLSVGGTARVLGNLETYGRAGIGTDPISISGSVSPDPADGEINFRPQLSILSEALSGDNRSSGLYIDQQQQDFWGAIIDGYGYGLRTRGSVLSLWADGPAWFGSSVDLPTYDGVGVAPSVVINNDTVEGFDSPSAWHQGLFVNSEHGWAIHGRGRGGFGIRAEGDELALRVDGSIRIDDGTAESGSVLTALDEEGNAVWSRPEFSSYSDYRLKDDIRSITAAGDIISRLNGVRFNWQESGEADIGLIAQEVEEVLPELVGEIGGYKALDYSRLSAVLIEAVKELQAEQERLIDQHQEQINELEQENQKLWQAINELDQ